MGNSTAGSTKPPIAMRASMSGNRPKPPSLAQLFDAPDEFVGEFGWLCGYSADMAFLNDATERFTRQTERQRAYTGRIAIGLMLDLGNPQIPCVQTPSVLHLPLK